MYELQLVNNGCLAEYSEDYKVFVDSILLDSETLKKLNSDEDVYTDIIDVEFSPAVKKVDRVDTLVAVTSGFMALLLDQLLIRKNIREKDIDEDTIIKVLPLVLRQYSDKNKDVDKEIDEYIANWEHKLKDANKYKNLIFDFCEDLSFSGMLIQVIEYCFDLSIGLDEKSGFVIKKVKHDLKTDSIVEKAQMAIVDWFVEQAYAYKKSGKYKKEFVQIEKIVKDIKKVAFKDNKFDREQLKEWFHNRVLAEKKKLNGLDDFVVQSIPVKANIIFVHSYAHIRDFIQQVNEHNVVSLEGLNIIDFDKLNNEAVIRRMDTISTSVFTAFNVGVAGAKAIMLDKNLLQKMYVFAININIPNVIRLVSVVRADADYIKEDIEQLVHKSKVVEIKKHKDIPLESLERCFTMNKIETRILYSLELQMIEEDIQRTKDNKEQLLKNEWKEKWIEITEQALQQNKVFEKDSLKTYAAINTYASNQENLLWLYNIAVELSMFKPYFRLEEKDKKLKLSYTKYVEEVFCNAQNYISYKEIQKIQKSYKNYYNYLENNTLKAVGVAGGAIAVAAATGGLAFVFAPQIAVAIFGGAFPTLHGAALVSASLAAAGGGSLAAGGFGMAGGAVLIAGGGAVLGLGTSGTALSLMMAPKFVQNDYAKLLAKCDCVLLKQLDMKDEVVALQHKMQSDLDEYKLRLKVLEGLENPNDECKQNIKALKKSIAYTERTNKQLVKLI
ncbi:hypothetical protein [Holdemanella sp.]|uniref:hypothetical protein n=1 Tax=Holdemanella sp. TaxID=1971762 RepID=UPI002582B09B|nr:hypothetical protein [Holdemanella sp.]